MTDTERIDFLESYSDEGWRNLFLRSIPIGQLRARIDEAIQFGRNVRAGAPHPDGLPDVDMDEITRGVTRLLYGMSPNDL